MLLWGVFSDGCLLGSLGFWSPINRDPRPFGIHLDVSCSQSLLCSLSHSAFCISNHSLFVALLRCLSFPVAFAICSTATPVVINFPGGPFNDYNPTLRWNFIFNSGASLLLGKPLIPYFFSSNVALNCFLGLFVAFLGYDEDVAKSRMYSLGAFL